MGIKIDGAKSFQRLNDVRLPSSTPRVNAPRNPTVRDAFFGKHASESPFSLRRQMTVLDPQVNIAMATYNFKVEQWWPADLVKNLPPLPVDLEKPIKQNSELLPLLKLVARDESYLKINWCDGIS